MSSYHQKKLIGIATLVLYIFIIILWISYFWKDTEASNYYPPRIQQICYDNWYGTDWDKAKKYEKRCRKLWTAWTNEINSSN